MSSSIGPETTWRALIDPFRQRLDSYKQTPISSEEDFRALLKPLCEKHREFDFQRLIIRIRKQHSPIIDLARGIDSALELKEPAEFTALIWGISYTAIRAALEAKQKLAGFAEETKKLNVIFPSLNRDNLKKYHHDSKVREPLQQLFRSYMEIYMAIFSKSAPPTLRLDEFNAAIDGKQALFESQQQHWKKAFAEAQDAEQNRMINGYGSSLGDDGPRMLMQPTNLSFEFIRELGQGAFGRVCEVRQIPKGDYFAQKFVRAPHLNQNPRVRQQIRARVINEVATSKKLQHHHIASVLLWTEEHDGFSLIMPTVAQCDLRTFLEGCINDKFPEERTKLLDHWFGCLITALKFAHANKIKHDDLKPSNILIKEDRVYLADFGCARDFEGSQLSSNPEEDITGTPVYRPPGSGTPGRAGDVFALGCVFSEMLTVRQGRSLAEYQAARKVGDQENPYAYRKNLKAVHQWLEDLPGAKRGIPNILLDMILIMLKEDLDERESAKDLRLRLNDTLFCGSCL